MTHRVAMDIGGTFTDVITYDTSTATLRAGKVLTTPGDLAEGVFAALDHIDVRYEAIDFFVHGTTQGLNALLQRRGAKVLLATSEGIGDVYRIARGNRDRLFDLHYRKPRPLVERTAIEEIGGRLGPSGDQVRPLDEAGVRRVAARVRDEGFTAVVVCLLFAYADARHERRAGEILREELGDGVLIVLSHEVAPEWREYERMSTAVLEGYTGPSVHHYLDRVEDRFAQRGLRVPVHVMQSSGGLVNADYARRHPLQTLLSGPVGGTMGSVAAARLLQRPDVICIDMGGTSFDVSLVMNYAPDVSPSGVAEGFPMLMPTINLHTVGAGGGSLAYCEAGGLRVGPESAGADPGPACYGRGGTQATVTDANCVLGRIDPDSFAGGGMGLDVDAARTALERLSAEFNLTPLELAAGICDVSNAKMAQAIRTLTVEHGREPSDFALLAFGGAGPMHAAFIATEIGVSEVIIPQNPGAFSAWGMLEADVRRDFSRQFFATGDSFDGTALTAVLDELRHEAWSALDQQGVAESERSVEHAVAMRYESQDFTLSVPLDSEDDPTQESFQPTMRQRFADLHRLRYGHASPDAPVQYITVRTTAHGLVPRCDARPDAPSGPAEPIVRDVVFQGRQMPTRITGRRELAVGARIEGPTVVHEDTATTVVPPGAVLRVDPHGFLLLTLSASEDSPR